MQSVVFDRKRWDLSGATKWLRASGFSAGGMDLEADVSAYLRGTLYALAMDVYGEDLEAAKHAGKTRWEAEFRFTKMQPEQRKVFGWLYVCRRKDGSIVVDHSREVVSIEELESATYGYVLDHRNGGVMHRRNADGSLIKVARLCECICYTPEKKAMMEVPDGVLPDGTWIGLQIDDEPTWLDIKSGKLRMFSFGGWARRQPLAAG